MSAPFARRPWRRAAHHFRRRGATRSSVPAFSSSRCEGGRRRSRPGRSRGSGWPVPAAWLGWLPAWFGACLSSQVTFSCLRLMADSDQIVTPADLAGECFMTVPTCLIKCFSASLPVIQRRFCRNLRLDGNTCQGDKAAHENVFRHLWHLHYWLASRWSGRFRLIFPQIGQTPRPAGWSLICVSRRAGFVKLSSEPGRHECPTHRRACASTTR